MIKVHIEPKAQYIEEQSLPDQGKYVYAYTIVIRNDGDEAITLLRRHWIISDGNNAIQEVEGEGVIGKQPTLQPGQGFQYTSGAVIATPTGIMQGRYTFARESGEEEEAEIPTFALIKKGALH